jgi:hypothetical protein
MYALHGTRPEKFERSKNDAVSDESAASLNELRMSCAFPPQMTVGIATDELRSNCFSSLVEA